MATVITSIGSKSAVGDPVNGQMTMISNTGSGTPWTGTLVVGSAPTANVGDMVYFHQVYYNCGGMGGGCSGPADIIYLITAVSGATLTIKYISGGANSAPMDLKSNSVGSSPAQPYVLRYYSTITTWEAGLDTGDIYSSGDRAQGECYADSPFTQTGELVMNTGNNLTGGRILTVPVGQRHDGTADSGAKVNLASGGGFAMWYQAEDGITTGPITIEWLELDGGDSEQSYGAWRVMFLTAGGNSTYVGTASHMLIHGIHNSASGNGGIIQGSSNFSLMHNNIVYDCSGRTQTSAFGAAGKGIVCNNTAYKMGVTISGAANAGSREAIGVSCSANNTVVKNNIAMGGYILHSASNGTVHDFYGTDIGTYNLSGDSTATGSNSITGVSTASLFISTTSGSEDLHILRSSSAVGAGDDLGTGVSNEGISAGSSTYGSPINRDINHGDRNAFAMAWDIGASQNSFISTIGTALGSVGSGTVTLTSGSTSVTGVNTNFTSAFTGGTAPPQVVEIPSGGGTYYTVKSVENDTTLTLTSDPGVSAGSQSWKVGTRDYSSVAVWEADLDDADYYGAGSTVRGECYDDSDFSISAAITVDGGGTVGLDAVILSVAAGQRHDGTAKEVGGSGVRFLWAAPGDNARSQIALKIDEAREAWVEWIDFDVNGYGLHSGSMVAALQLHGGQYYTAGYANGAAWCIVHDNTGQQTVGSGDHTFGIIATGRSKFIVNCIVYNMSNKGYEDCFGIYTDNQDAVVVCNNTVYNIHGFDNSPALSDAIGFSTSTRANAVYRNNISARVYEATSTKCYGSYSGGDINNLSTDDTADGTNSIADVDYTTLFHSTTAGAEDLHILRSSKAVGAGTDLGTHLTFWPGESGYEQNVPVTAGLLNRDINHGDRNSRAMAWDIGASQNAIVSTIGTTGREYSTVAAWTAHLDEDTYYGAGSTARGECYADTAFTAGHLENGGTIGLVAAVLTAADGQQHDGTAGTGVVFNMSETFDRTASGGVRWFVSFLEFTQSSTFNETAAVNSRTVRFDVSHCLIHGYDLRHSTAASVFLLHQPAGGSGSGNGRSAHNNILYDLTRGIVGSQNCTLYGILQDGAYAVTSNNTVYNIHADSTDGSITQSAVGIRYERSYHWAVNNIVMGLSSANGTTTSMICDDSSTPSKANNNMVNDTSSGAGTSSQTGKSSSGQFVSTTTGSEDLHLVTGSDAIGNGADLGLVTDYGWSTSTGASKYVWGQNYDINRGNRDAFSQTWDIGASQYEIIAKIGTSSRDFSTIDAWEAQLDNTDYYGKGSHATGECYNDTTFEMSSGLLINGGGTVGLEHRTLTVAVGQRHTGVANTGARILFTGTGSSNTVLHMDNSVGSKPNVTGNQIEWLEVDCNEKKIAAGIFIQHYSGVQNCIIHSARWLGTYNSTAGIETQSKQTWICNNIVYNIHNDAGGTNSYGTYGIVVNKWDWEAIVNNTVYGVTSDATAGGVLGAWGIWQKVPGQPQYQRVYNNISMGTSHSGTGTAVDYYGQSHTSYTASNYTSDATAEGDNYQRNQSAADTFVSIAGGSEDFHIKSGSNALRAGKDAGTTETVVGKRMPYSPYVWDVDINGRSRDAEGDDWDIGAHQCEDCSEGGAVTNTAFMFFVD